MAKTATTRRARPATTEAASPMSRKAARILEAAGSCFAEKGFQRTTVEDIAGAAGVSRPLVYKHFGDKDALIDAVLEDTFEGWLVYNAEPFEESADSASAALEAKIAGAVAFARARPIFQAILRQDPQLVFAGHGERFLECRARSRQRSLDILRAGIRTGEFRSDFDLEATADSLEMILFVLLERALGIRPGQSLDGPLQDATIQLVIAGLRSARVAPARPVTRGTP